MRRLIGLLPVILALVAPAASAHTTIIEPPGSHFPYQRWVDEARVPTPDVTLSVIEGVPPGVCPEITQGCTRPFDGKIWIDTDEGTQAPLFVRGYLHHELGHNVDVYSLPDWMRVRFMVIFALQGAWAPSGSLNDPTPELFADVYGDCARQPKVKPGFGIRWGAPWMGESPVTGGVLRHNRVCRMLAKLPG